MPVADQSTDLHQRLDETLQFIRNKTAFKPSLGLILGSGLGALTQTMRVEASFDYGELPHMPHSTAPGHEGKLILGELGSALVAVFSGRFHYYEGYTTDQIGYPVRLLRALGARMLVLTSIVGSMNPDMPPGTLVLLDDHINLMGISPLVGPNDDRLGPRFPDMSAPYDPTLASLAREVAQAEELPLRKGVYVAVTGPHLETRAEYRFLRKIGADVVGMSMVPEVITACHAGLRILAVTVVSDACDPENLKPAVVEELLRVAAETEPKLTALLTGVIKKIDVV